MSSEIHHRFNSKNVARLDLRTESRTPVIRDLRVLVHAPANAVPDVVSDDRITIRFGMFLDRPTNIAKVVTDPALLDRSAQAVLSNPDQLEPFFANLADRDRSGRIADETLQRHATVDRKDVAILQLIT